MLARGLPGIQYVNNITDFPKALGNSAAGVVRKRLRAPLELRLCLASFRGMMGLVFKPPLRLARDVTVRTLDDAAEFARTYVGPRLPHRRDRVCTVSKRYPTRPARVLKRERFARGQYLKDCWLRKVRDNSRRLPGLAGGTQQGSSYDALASPVRSARSA